MAITCIIHSFYFIFAVQTKKQIVMKTRFKVTSYFICVKNGSKPSFYHTLYFTSLTHLYAYYHTLCSLGYVFDKSANAYILDLGDKLHFIFLHSDL